jgi:hypothetical protein
VANENDFLLADDFAQAIDDNRDTVVGIRASHAVFATVEAALESCRTGEVVEVK